MAEPFAITTGDLQGIVIVRYDEHGEIDFHVCGGETVRLFIVDERAPHDRVYEWTQRCTPEEIREIIPAGTEVGSNQDARHPAVVHVVEAIKRGERRLRVVEEEEG